MMPSTTDPQIVADASSGFHDIKALPEFSPISTLWLSPILLLLAYCAFKYFKNRSKARTAPVIPPRDPKEVALEELTQLELDKSSGKVSVRQFATGLSLILRSYWQSVLDFDATEQTARELTTSLPAAMRKRFSLSQKERNKNQSEFTTTMLSTLKFCERAAFSDKAETLFTLGTAEVDRHLDTTRDSIEKLSTWLKDEQRAQEARERELTQRKTGNLEQAKA